MNETTDCHPTGHQSTAGTGTSADELFDVLSDARRRTALTVLTGQRSMSVPSLARAVAAREQNADPTDVSDDYVDRVHLRLHHVHLPKLDEVRLVDHDREAETATATTDKLDANELTNDSPVPTEVPITIE